MPQKSREPRSSAPVPKYPSAGSLAVSSRPRLFIGFRGEGQQRAAEIASRLAARQMSGRALSAAGLVKGCHMHKVAVIVGSIRKDSINKKLAGALAKLAEGKLAFDYVKIDDLPLFNQDNETSPTPEVTRNKAQIAAADGLLFLTPEHNRSIPAAMKNAIDWATRPHGTSAFRGKPGAIIGASRGGIATAIAQSHLRVILAGHLVATLGTPEAHVQFKDGLIDDSGNVTDETTKKFLQGFVDNFVKLVAAIAR